MSVTLLVVLAAFAHDASAQIPTPEIQNVRFDGNVTFPADSLAAAIVTQETECRSKVLVVPFCVLGVDFALRRAYLRTRELPRDQARLMIWYQRRGFLGVQVDTPTVVGGAGVTDVIFRIEEGRPVIADTITFLGVTGAGRGILADLPLRQGDRLSTLALDATSDTIRRRLNNQGYAYADVLRRAFRPAADPYAAEVTFEIVTGPRVRYGRIDVAGLDNLELATVLRTIRISSGDVFSIDQLEEARGRLSALEIVRNASVVAGLNPEPDSVVDVQVSLQEGDAYRMRVGGGWTTAECLNVEARWASRNFLGGGRSLQVRGRAGNVLAPEFGDVLCTQSGDGDFSTLTWLGSVDFLQPWIFSTRNSATASVFVERQTLPDVFIRRAVGFRAGLGRTIAPRTVLTGFYRPELSELDADDALFCTGFLVCSPDDIAALEGANWVAPVGVSLSQDRSDDLLNPRRGRRLSIEYETAASWTASDFRYARVVGEGAWYAPLTGSTVVASRLRGGWVSAGGFADLGDQSQDVVHPQKRFYAGGANSVRGFGQSRLGPRVLVTNPSDLTTPMADGGAGCTPQQVVALTCDASALAESRFDPQPTGGTRVLEANLEFRVGLATWLEMVAFGDVGQAWGTGESIALEDLEFTPGVGIRFPSPVGPIRLDLAYRFAGQDDLSVITTQLRPYDQIFDDLDSCLGGDCTLTPWVVTDQLAALTGMVPFGSDSGRLQFHVSIGQAF